MALYGLSPEGILRNVLASDVPALIQGRGNRSFDGTLALQFDVRRYGKQLKMMTRNKRIRYTMCKLIKAVSTE